MSALFGSTLPEWSLPKRYTSLFNLATRECHAMVNEFMRHACRHFVWSILNDAAGEKYVHWCSNRDFSSCVLHTRASEPVGYTSQNTIMWIYHVFDHLLSWTLYRGIALKTHYACIIFIIYHRKFVFQVTFNNVSFLSSWFTTYW